VNGDPKGHLNDLLWIFPHFCQELPYNYVSRLQWGCRHIILAIVKASTLVDRGVYEGPTALSSITMLSGKIIAKVQHTLGLLTKLLWDCEGVGSVIVLDESPCPWGPIYKSLSSDHKSLSSSLCPCPRTSSPWQHHWVRAAWLTGMTSMLVSTLSGLHAGLFVLKSTLAFSCSVAAVSTSAVKTVNSMMMLEYLSIACSGVSRLSYRGRLKICYPSLAVWVWYFYHLPVPWNIYIVDDRVVIHQPKYVPSLSICNKFIFHIFTPKLPPLMGADWCGSYPLATPLLVLWLISTYFCRFLYHFFVTTEFSCSALTL